MELIKVFNDNSNSIAAFAAVGALIISTIAIIKATRDNQKQILVGKIEEIYELIIFLAVEYEDLYILYTLFDNHHNDKYSAIEQREFLDNYTDELERIKTIINIDDLFNKIFRLNVLANSYLEKSLKLDVLAYGQLFESLIIVSTKQRMKRKERLFKEGFPTKDNVYKLVGHLSDLLVRKINLGGEYIGKSEYDNYQDNEFKIKLGLK
jgi:hypothetical protein